MTRKKRCWAAIAGCCLSLTDSCRHPVFQRLLIIFQLMHKLSKEKRSCVYENRIRLYMP
ncbi:hypothetical protein HMPREF9406_0640 [Clostridium sp. HGF2]|nr:hypothetical protein HMPREF9406_0640 [Clostridium sp. HGF2]EQJ58590.1 hypothetical protein QSI_1872 [Clostridioides difficile P28]